MGLRDAWLDQSHGGFAALHRWATNPYRGSIAGEYFQLMPSLRDLAPSLLDVSSLRELVPILLDASWRCFRSIGGIYFTRNTEPLRYHKMLFQENKFSSDLALINLQATNRISAEFESPLDNELFKGLDLYRSSIETKQFDADDQKRG